MKKMNDILQSIFPLSQGQINEFLTTGILVVDNVLSQDELQNALEGLNRTLQKYGVDSDDLENTGYNLEKLSSTNGSGGVLDLFHPMWKLKISENPKLFSIISQLWKAAYNTKNENYPSPFGQFPYTHGYMYLDRIGYRIPTKLSDTIGSNLKKKQSLQRSLTPHLDCCPTTIINNEYTKVNKWRPFQSFVALTDTVYPNEGGFEAVPGFHLQFNSWTKHRKNTIGKNNREIPPPCLGEFTPVRPREDKDVIDQMKHIPCKAGSFVIWDNRIPHSNSLYNNSNVSRAVVYTSFLPDVSINRQYITRQLKLYREKRKMIDQWSKNRQDFIEDEDDYEFSTLGKFMMGIDDWDRLDCNDIDGLYSIK